MVLEYTGKYASCKVMTDVVDPATVQQIYGFLNCPVFAGAKIRVQADCHAGAGAVIGFTSTLTDKVIPHVIGVDIACGVLSVCLGKIPPPNFEEFDKYLRAHVPAGFAIHDTFKKPIEKVIGKSAVELITETAVATNQDPNYVLRSIGTLGGGNHLIEVGSDPQGRLWLTIHTGSRNFGLKIANFHQKKATEKVGKHGGLEWLEGADVELYLEHSDVASLFAEWSRHQIATSLLAFFNLTMHTVEEQVCSVHNYIDLAAKLIRKGAISAKKDEMVVIPWNMRDGLVIGQGKGNSEYNFSAPHGAGRIMGRGEAKRSLSLAEFESTMKGVWSSCIKEGTLDESPMAYKDPAIIQESLKDTVEVLFTVKPLYNFKG